MNESLELGKAFKALQLSLISITCHADTMDRSGSTGPSTRPKLALKPRSEGLPAAQLPPAASRGETSLADEPAEPLVVPKTGPRSNPFGSAKPVDVKERTEPSPVRCGLDGRHMASMRGWKTISKP